MLFKWRRKYRAQLAIEPAPLLPVTLVSDRAALEYARPALAYYCEDAQAEIDNLIAERALRGVAIGRRNYLFAGADSGGERAAAMYSLIGSARLNRINPEAYLAYVLERRLPLPYTFACPMAPGSILRNQP